MSASLLRSSADIICKQGAVDLAEIAQSRDGVTGNPGDVLAATRSKLRELESLRPPRNLARRFRHFLTIVRNREQQRQRVLANLSHAPHKAGLAVARFNHFTAEGNAAARRLELKYCPGF